MIRRLVRSLAAIVALGILAPVSAYADFGFKAVDVRFSQTNGTPVTQAGSHPSAMDTEFALNTHDGPAGPEIDASLRDLQIDLPPGLVVNPNAVPTCSNADFAHFENEVGSKCPASAAVGYVLVRPPGEEDATDPAAVYNLVPPPGAAARLGFHALGVTIVVDGGVRTAGTRNIFAALTNLPQAEPFDLTRTVLWGNPAASAHDSERGNCVLASVPGTCPASSEQRAFITLGSRCEGPLNTHFAARPWQEPAAWVHAEPPDPVQMTGCDKLGFSPSINAKPTAQSTASPSGLDFDLDVDDEGLINPSGISDAHIRKAVVTLPEGVTINPAQAEGLLACPEAGFEREAADSEPGQGCPQASKIGTVEVKTPLLDETLGGALFIATPYENPTGKLIAIYMVIRNRARGIVVKQAGMVESDSDTGQLVTTFDDLPQLPFSHFHLHFNEGARSPLVTPPGCGKYVTQARFTPWSDPAASYHTTSSFQIKSGIGGGPCPKGGLPPFKPGLIAGSINNAAGKYSPFNLRLFRTDAEQEITHFSIKLPPGIVGKLAGIPFCPEAAIAAAKARTGPLGGHEELAAPSCPAASEVGHTLAGAGVGSALTYVPGKIYLAGPYNGSALSIVAITSGVAGPFDLGTVVVRQALKINPETAEVFIDATGSDPIPHIIQGIPVHLRDIRAYVDKPDFVLNPTSCSRTSTASTVLGSGLNFASPADDAPVTVSTPFQAADCASLNFKPRLSLTLKGGTKRGQNPALRAVLRPRAGDANSRRISVQLPHSEFLDQSHIRTVCTRVQFKAGAGNGSQCPAGSIYGKAKAWTPLLSEPLEGPVFLRSSENPLPDLVLALSGLIDFNAVGRIDSVDGGIRNTFDFVPDAPVTKVVVDFEGGKKGLLENSTDLCRAKHKAIVKYQGHNGKRFNAKPVLKAKCPQARKGKGKGAKGKGQRAARDHRRSR